MSMPLQSALVVAGCALAALAGRSNVNIVRAFIDVDSMEHNVSLVADGENRRTNTSHSQGGKTNLHLEPVSGEEGKKILTRMTGEGTMILLWRGDTGSKRVLATVRGGAMGFRSRMHLWGSGFKVNMAFKIPKPPAGYAMMEYAKDFELHMDSQFFWKDGSSTSVVFDLPGMTARQINGLAYLHKPREDIFHGSGCSKAEDGDNCQCCLKMQGEVENLNTPDISISLRLKREVTEARPPYMMGDVMTNECPGGYAPIIDADECKAAAFPGYVFVGSINHPARPKDCHAYNTDIYYNAHRRGAAEASSRTICKAVVPWASRTCLTQAKFNFGCTTGKHGSACRTCVPFLEREAHGHCASCNSGFELVETAGLVGCRAKKKISSADVAPNSATIFNGRDLDILPAVHEQADDATG